MVVRVRGTHYVSGNPQKDRSTFVSVCFDAQYHGCVYVLYMMVGCVLSMEIGCLASHQSHLELTYSHRRGL